MQTPHFDKQRKGSRKRMIFIVPKSALLACYISCRVNLYNFVKEIFILCVHVANPNIPNSEVKCMHD
jgi:hypothetical protein